MVFVLGLGEAAKLDADSMRSAAAALGRRLSGAKCESARFELHHALGHDAVALKADKAGQAVGEAFGLLGFTFDHYRGSVNNKKERTGIALSSSLASFTKGMERDRAAESANFSRFLSNSPLNVATPEWMAEQCKDTPSTGWAYGEGDAGRHAGARRPMGLVTVGQASVNKPCMIRIECRRGAQNAKTLVLVGKTLTMTLAGCRSRSATACAG